MGFEPGATVMVLAGELGSGQTARYILSAHEGDLLMAHSLFPGEDLRVSVHRLDQETPVPDAVETESYWAGRLPATCGYLVEVHGAGDQGPFHLEFQQVERLLGPTAEAATETQGALEVMTRTCSGEGQKIVAKFTSRILIEYAITSN